MTQQEMNLLAPQKLRELEREHQMKVLCAVESGSRAWGFASPDSDFDVRFVYVRPREFYLKLEKTRDVIEEPIDDTWDVSGWDLPKTLRLLHASNPSIFEWGASPLVYCSTETWERRIAPALPAFFRPYKSVYHYLSMAFRTAKENLAGETVKAKKYFYILRPILAAKWVIANGTPPPMLFEELVDSQLEEALVPMVNELVRKKKELPELDRIPRIPVLDEYIYAALGELQVAVDVLPRGDYRPWEPLNRLFAEILAESSF